MKIVYVLREKKQHAAALLFSIAQKSVHIYKYKYMLDARKSKIFFDVQK